MNQKLRSNEPVESAAGISRIEKLERSDTLCVIENISKSHLVHR